MNYARTIATLLLSMTVLGCSGKEDVEEPKELLKVSGAKSATVSLSLIMKALSGSKEIRPSATMGIFSSMYLAQQGGFLSVQSALEGIETQNKLLSGQTGTLKEETFVLLQEFGSVLQVDVNDMLNRSTDRSTALNRYIQTLKNVTILAERKEIELETQLKQTGKERKEQRKVVRELKRDIKKALKEEEYTAAGYKQPLLVEAESQLAETETKERQTEDILDRYKDLIEIAQERLQAIEENRKILVTGLKVIDIPGVKGLDIIEKKRSRRR